MKNFFVIIMLLTTVGCKNLTQRSDDSSTAAIMDSRAPGIKLQKDSPWKTIKNSGKINIPHNQRIDRERQKLLKSKRAFQQLITRSEPYMYYIINQLKKRCMPIELAIIPLMESAYNPQALSPAKAAGLWQIIPTTAKAYGMVSSRWYDPRRDLIASTETALDYLQHLNKLFDGDWLLTLAAYNAGEGRIRQAQLWNKSHHLPPHYWALNLPDQTMQYVPKLLAIINIIRNHESYGINLPKGGHKNKLIRFNIGQGIKLETISQLTDLTMDDLEAYNAGYIKKKLNSSHHLLIPSNQAKKLYDQLTENNFSNVKVVDLSTLSKNKNDYKPCGVCITNGKYVAITDHDLESYWEKHNSHRQTIYQIKPGDNLSSIAKDHKIKIEQLVKYNSIKNVDKLRVGDKLIINKKN